LSERCIVQTMMGKDALCKLVVEVAKTLARCGRHSEATKLARAAMGTEIFDTASQNQMLRFLDVSILWESKMYAEAWQSMRVYCLNQPYNVRAWCLLNKIAIQAGTWNLNHKQLVRQLLRHPESVPMTVLVGHHCAVAGSFRLALGEYYRAFRAMPEDPLISMCIGVTLLRMAMQKLTPNRHKAVLEAMAFLQQYVRLRGVPVESDYNIGRAYHQLGLVHLAIPRYQKVLNASGKVVNLKREAALNLSSIYRHGGANGLAAQMLRDYVSL